MPAAGSVDDDGGSVVEVDEDVLVEDVVDVVEEEEEDVDVVDSWEGVGSADVDSAAVDWVVELAAEVVGSLVLGADVVGRVGEVVSP